MAFATQNVRSSAFGNLNVTAGDWTGSAGDATGTIGVEGGRVYLAEFSMQGTGESPVQKAAVSVSTSGRVTTVSIYNHETVTTGRFIIIHV